MNFESVWFFGKIPDLYVGLIDIVELDVSELNKWWGDGQGGLIRDVFDGGMIKNSLFLKLHQQAPIIHNISLNMLNLSFINRLFCHISYINKK